MRKTRIFEIVRYTVADSPAGAMLLCRSVKGLAALAFVSERNVEAALEDLRLNLGAVRYVRDDKALRGMAADAVRFMSGNAAAARAIPLDLCGTEFQKRVWKELLRITRGASATYSDIAARIGRPTAVRAVATAIGDNPVSLLVPCHRILRKDGSLGGYRWGLGVKRRLLELESGSSAPRRARRVIQRLAA